MRKLFLLAATLLMAACGVTAPIASGSPHSNYSRVVYVTSSNGADVFVDCANSVILYQVYRGVTSVTVLQLPISAQIRQDWSTICANSSAR